MEYIQISGKTREEAIQKAIEKLNTSIDKLDIKVIEEGSKGFLGIGAKDYVISVKKIISKEDIIVDFLKKVYSSLNININIDIQEDENMTRVTISGQDSQILIGKHGESLDGLQTILNVVLAKELGEYVKVHLDIDGYRKKREESIISYAKKMAQKALRLRRSVKLDPMNPYERRIVHSSLQDEENITTFSQGEEPNRRIVIGLKNFTNKKRY